MKDLVKHKIEIVFVVLQHLNNDGTQNIDIVNDVINQINEFNKDMLVVIKVQFCQQM